MENNKTKIVVSNKWKKDFATIDNCNDIVYTFSKEITLGKGILKDDVSVEEYKLYFEDVVASISKKMNLHKEHISYVCDDKLFDIGLYMVTITQVVDKSSYVTVNVSYYTNNYDNDNSPRYTIVGNFTTSRYDNESIGVSTIKMLEWYPKFLTLAGFVISVLCDKFKEKKENVSNEVRK